MSLYLSNEKYNKNIQKLTKNLQLKDDVLFLGFKNNPFKYIAKADLFVLSSLWEGFPNVLIEAMVCGLPIISTGCRSGPREILAPTYRNKVKNDYYKAEYGVIIPEFNGIKY